jgi:hypothetical protein
MNLHRAELDDLWSDGTRTAVFANDNVVVLSEMASTILAAIPEQGSTTLDEVVAVVVSAYGPPEPPVDAVAVVGQQVEDLAAHKIVVCDSTGG